MLCKYLLHCIILGNSDKKKAYMFSTDVTTIIFIA